MSAQENNIEKYYKPVMWFSVMLEYILNIKYHTIIYIKYIYIHTRLGYNTNISHQISSFRGEKKSVMVRCFLCRLLPRKKAFANASNFFSHIPASTKHFRSSALFFCMHLLRFSFRRSFRSLACLHSTFSVAWDRKNYWIPQVYSSFKCEYQ